MKSSFKEKVFIDGTPLINKHLSGVGQVVLQTVRALNQSEYVNSHHFILFAPIDEKGKLEQLELNNIDIKYLPFPHKFLSLFSRLPYSPPLDLFLGKGVYLFMNFRSWPLLFSRSITYLHDVAFLKYPQFIEPRNLRFLAKHVQRWVKQSTRVVAVSHATEVEVKEELPISAAKLETIVNAVDGAVFKPQEVSVLETVKEKYGVGDFFLFVSNIEPRKNIETLIKAYKKSVGKTGSTQLFIVGGNGWLNEPIVSAIQQAQSEGYKVIKNTHFVPDEDLPALMQAARSVIIPSWHEGFGLPLLQAIASGGSVIASNIPSLQEAARLVGNKRVTFFNPNRQDELEVRLNAARRANVSSVDVKIRQWTDVVEELVKLIDEVKVGKK